MAISKDKYNFLIKVSFSYLKHILILKNIQKVGYIRRDKMITNDEIKNLKKSIEEQNILIEELLNSNKIYLDKIEYILSNQSSDNTSMFNQKILEGDYISFYSNLMDSIVIGKIIGNGDNCYQLYYPLLNEVDYCCYNSIEELIDDYTDCSEFVVIHTGKYSNMIPNKSSFYVLYKSNRDEDKVYKAKLSREECSFVLYSLETGDVLVSGNTYEETIFNAMENYNLVIPLREN